MRLVGLEVGPNPDGTSPEADVSSPRCTDYGSINGRAEGQEGLRVLRVLPGL